MVEAALGRADAAVTGPGAAAAVPLPMPQAVKRVRVCASSNKNTRILFSMLRVLACDPHDRGQREPGVPGVCRGPCWGDAAAAVYRTCRNVRHPLSVRNERSTMRLLLDVIDRALSKCTTMLQEDVSDLSDASYLRFSNRRHAKIQVRDKKEVLHHFADWAQTSLEVLDVIKAELEEKRGCGDGNGNSKVTANENGPAAAALAGGGGFDAVARKMEEEEGKPGQLGQHHTIVQNSLKGP